MTLFVKNSLDNEIYYLIKLKKVNKFNIFLININLNIFVYI